MALKLPDNPGLCDELAQKYGALAGDGIVCVPVSGKEILIKDNEYSLQEMAEITNYNFHCSGVKGGVQKAEQLPGPVENTKKDLTV